MAASDADLVATLRAGVHVVADSARGGLRALDRDRRAALALAVVLLVALALPWRELVVTASGRDGVRLVARQASTGAGSLSLAAVVCAIVAVVAVVGLPLRAGHVPAGLGSTARQRARARVDGAALAAGGAVAALCCLLALVDRPAPRLVVGHAAVHARFGIVVGLLLAVALAALGVRIALAGRPPAPDRGGDPGGPPSPRRARGRPARADRRSAVSPRRDG